MSGKTVSTIMMSLQRALFAKTLSALMIATALFGFAAALPTFASIPQPSAYIILDPALSLFTTPSMVVGSTFNVNVSLVNITGVAAVQFELTWDPTLLACIGMTEVLFHTATPTASWSNIWQLQLDFNNTGGYADYAYTYLNVRAAIAAGYAPINITTTNYPPEGKLAVATLTFQVLQVPTMAQSSLTCAFHFSDVVIADVDGNSVSAGARDGTYIIARALSASISPVSATLDVGGQPQLFTSAVSGGTSPYTYQWYLNYVPVSGATSNSWTFMPTSSGSCTIYLNVTDSVGAIAISNTTTVNVNASPSVSILPSSVVMDVGQSQTFTSTVSGGTGSYSYQWYLNGAPQSGATSAAWTFTPPLAGSYIQIYVKVTDSIGTEATSNASTVNVNAPPSVSILPSSVVMDVGQSQTFTSAVSGGTLPYTYQWCLNGIAVPGANFSSWTFTPNLTGSYTIYANVTDSVGVQATSNTATVTVNIGTHDVAVTNVASSKTVVGQGFSANTSVTVANQGDFTETFNITVYSNTTSIASQNVTLSSGSSKTVTFTWNTTGFAYGNYTISAYALPVPGETKTANNNITDGTIEVAIPGDVKGDGIVNVLDAIVLGNAFLATLGSGNWNPNADINGDGVVNILDAIILGNHFLQHYP